VSMALGRDIAPVRADPVQIEQVIVNLVINARDAMERGGLLTIETREVMLTRFRNPTCIPGRHVMLAVTDTGCGMTDEVKARAFEPFFTTKEPGKGTGLGLATVYGIVRQSGGDVAVHSEPGVGSSFKVYLPAVASPDHRPDSIEPRPAPNGHETVLLVEDEDGVRRLTRLVLESHGYRVIEAGSGPQAIEAAKTHTGPIHLVVTDVIMPRMSGRELVRRLRSSYPDARVLFMSGYAQKEDPGAEQHDSEQPDGRADFLPKPFTPHDLACKVRDVLDQPTLPAT
jgi:two-component system, cell cycle sensor histidine kinase and response regulator CckA